MREAHLQIQYLHTTPQTIMFVCQARFLRDCSQEDRDSVCCHRRLKNVICPKVLTGVQLVMIVAVEGWVRVLGWMCERRRGKEKGIIGGVIRLILRILRWGEAET